MGGTFTVIPIRGSSQQMWLSCIFFWGSCLWQFCVDHLTSRTWILPDV